MSHKYHFISGLPRSGSTLLSALLKQNPRFHAAMSGPLAGMFNTMTGEMSGRNEFSVFINDDQRRRVLSGLFDNFYGHDFPAEVIFDTNRLWCSKLRVLKELMPNSKIIACVRHVGWVVDSIERLVRKNTFQPSTIFNFQPGGTVYSRADSLGSSDGMVGSAYNALKDGFNDEHAGTQLMLLQYETLTREPKKAMAAIYSFIGEPPFKHDFEHVEYNANEFDTRAGTPGLHKVKSRVQPVDRQMILPPEVARRFENDAFWRDPKLNIRGVRIV
ncbi:MAG: sulfotransferase [Lysobacteraceae bacterium]